MGNTQSAEAPRRLTKPRTNTSTSNLLALASAGSRHASNLELPVAPNKRSSTIVMEGVAETDDEVVTAKAASRPQRRSLFRSKSAQPEASVRLVEYAAEVEAQTSSNPLDRYSSMSSLKGATRGNSHGAFDAGLSMRSSRSLSTYDTRSQQPGRQSPPSEGQSDDQTPEDESNISGISFEGFDDIGQDITLRFPDDWEEDTSQPVLFRRRSMLTPGMATRSTLKENKHRKSLPARTHSTPQFQLGGEDTLDSADSLAHNRGSQRNLGYHSSDEPKPKDSMQEELAAIRALRLTAPPSRTVTPCDLEHRQTGAFKFGSLRIINGAASPSPSRQETRQSDVHSSTEVEAKSAEQTVLTIPPRAEGHGTEGIRNEWALKFGPPKKNRVRFEFHEVSDDPPRIVDTMVEIPGFSLEIAEFHTGSSPPKTINPQSPTRALEMAQAYIQEISSSPFSFAESVPPSPGLEPTSKHTAIEDNLFDDESGSCISSSPSPSVAPLSYSSRFVLQTQASVDTLNIPRAEKRASQQSLPRVIRGPREQPVKPLEKADSGYSSKSSLRSLKSRKASIEDASSELPSPPVPDKEPPPTPPKLVPARYSQVSSLSSSTSRISQVAQAEEAPPTPVKDWSPRWSSVGSSAKSLSPRSDEGGLPSQEELSVPPYRQAPPVPLKHSSTTSSGRTVPPPLPIKSIQQTQAAASSHAQEAPIPAQDTPPRRRRLSGTAPNGKARPVLKTSGSESSISSTTRRLQKQQPPAPQRVIMQGYTNVVSATIPPVSQEASDHLGERLKNFPELTHTYKSVHRTNSKETLATIFSMASAELRAEQMTSTWSRFSGQLPETPSNADIERSVSKISTPAPIEHVRGFSVVTNMLRKTTEKRQSRRRSFELPLPGRRRSSSADSQDQQFKIKDFGTVSESLGASPYDAAAIAASSEQPATSLKIRNDRKMAQRRTIGMDSDIAAQLARDRSRDRETERREQQQQASLQRRQSYDEDNHRFAIRDQPTSSPPILANNIPRSKFMVVDRSPPLPLPPAERLWDQYMPTKVRTPPPVSMRLLRKPVAAPQHAQLGREVASDEVPMSGESPLIAKARRRSHRQDVQGERSGLDSEVQRLASPADPRHRSTAHLSIAERSQLLLERGHQPPLQPYGGIADDDSGLQRPHGTSAPQPQPTASSARPKYPNNKSLARKSYDHSHSQSPRREHRDQRTLTRSRASFDSSITTATHSPNMLAQEATAQTQLVVADRYTSGFGYSYEPGHGVGGSAGMRHGASTASRKGLEGSVLWGVDLSDVPIIVYGGGPGGPEGAGGLKV